MNQIQLAYLKATKKWQFLEDPVWSWGIKIAFAIVIPLLIGIITGYNEQAMWVAIAAESTAFIDLKGDVAQRIRILTASILLNILFCILGALLGNIILLAIPFMFFVGYLSGIFKNLGEKGAALALSVYISCIISISFPIKNMEVLTERLLLFLTGGIWTAIVNLIGVYVIKEGSPYRRSIASIWKSVANLAAGSSKGWDKKTKKENLRTLYLKEKELRQSINSSLSFFSRSSSDIHQPEHRLYILTQSRKVAVLVGLHVIQIAELVDQIQKQSIDTKFSLKVFSLFRSIEHAGNRIAHYITHLKSEEKLVIESKIARLEKVANNIVLQAQDNEALMATAQQLQVLTNRIVRLLKRALTLLALPKEQRSYKSYSFLETLLILHPRHFIETIKTLFRSDTLTQRYALRVGVAAALGYILQMFAFKDHGYWIPLTAIIVSQPFVNATLRRGLERSIGTILGVIVGSTILFLPMSDIAQLGMAIISSLLTAYFLKTKYSIATFFITTLLIAMISIESTFDLDLLITRIICTVIGSSLAIIAGFLFFPTYDKKMLPKYMLDALVENYHYFQFTFLQNDRPLLQWVQYKRSSEIKNSDAFDSINRYIQETILKRKKGYAFYYFLIVHNIRITREINNFHTDHEFYDEKDAALKDKEHYIQLIYEMDETFRDIFKLAIELKNKFINHAIIHEFPIEGVRVYTPTYMQIIHIEKCLNELKAIKTILVNELNEKSKLTLAAQTATVNQQISSI